jgi:FlaA1/EpsC-like NDP-sugar epimerase
MTRYFMTIPEASQLVLQAGAQGRGGEIFVLDMGQQVRILDLAEALIRRNGLEPGRDIAVTFTGVRPGEKLYEELAGDDEQTRPTSHPKIRVWQLPTAARADVEAAIARLREAAEGSREDAIAALADAVPEYRPDGREVPVQAPTLRLVPAAEAA